jgi:hypothetical protein
MTGVDGGADFGTWGDETSQLIYHDAMPALLAGVDRTGLVLDLGGGNGLARQWFPRLHTVDLDREKGPDEVANIATYRPARVYDLVLLRYVAHYFDDTALARLLHRIASWHRGPLLLIQFVNDDLVAKHANSVNETKWFRTEDQLQALLAPWLPTHRVAVEYDVVPDFYRNRLGHPNPTGHRERVVAYLCEAHR